jgi:hypothetical protein
MKIRNVTTLALVLSLVPVSAFAQAPRGSDSCEVTAPEYPKFRFKVECITDADIAPCKETLRKGFEYEKKKNFVGTRDIVATGDAAIKEYVAQSGPFTYLRHADVAGLKGLRADYKRGIADKKRMSPERLKEYGGPDSIPYDESQICIVDIRLAYLEKRRAGTARPATTPSTGSAAPAAPSGGATGPAPSKPPKREPRSHVPEAMAHHCLKPQDGGGVVNDCPFSVEYSYCVERPAKGSWSESFECGKSGGSWQVGPGPGQRSIMHTAGAKVHWFACKYGPSISKPDGVSPQDVTFNPRTGRLEGRCAEWGAK